MSRSSGRNKRRTDTIKTELDATTLRIRRYTGEDDEPDHYTITGEDGDATVRIRAPPSEIEPELDRYVEDKLRAAVDDLDKWFHNVFKNEVEAQVIALEDSFDNALDVIRNTLNLTHPSQRGADSSANDGVAGDGNAASEEDG